MTVRNKKSTEIPFTQFWYNLSKQIQKQPIKANTKASKTSKHRNNQSQLINNIKLNTKDDFTRQRRLSMGCIQKRIADNQLIAPKHAQSNVARKDRQMCNLGEKSKTLHDQQNSMMEINANFPHHTYHQIKQNSTYSYVQKSVDDKVKVSDKILQVIQHNVIPFLVQKFVESEQKMNLKIKKLQGVINQQKQQINKLKQNEKQMNQMINKLKKSFEDKSLVTSQIISNSTSKRKINNKHSNCKCKVLVQVGNSPFKMSQNNSKCLQQKLSDQLCNRTITDPYEENIRQLGALLEQLTVTVDQSGSRNAEIINNIQKQMKKLSQKQKISQEKLEQQFAQKILDLISTYNDNFVDLDKRVSLMQEIISLNNQTFTKLTNRSIEASEKQKNFKCI